MSVKKYTALLAAFMAVNVQANATPTISEASTTTTTPTAEATCKFQVQDAADDVAPVGSYVGAEDASVCWEICNDAHYAPYCTSFTYEVSTKTCVFRDVTIRSGLEPADSGIYYWDKACWTDYPARSPVVPDTGCLASNATCGASGTSPNYEEFATFRKVTHGVVQCSEICNGAYFASRCKSYIYQADEAGACYFYDVAAAQFLVAADADRRTAWDRECLDNTGNCTSTAA